MTAALKAPRIRSKYGNRKTEYAGNVYDSNAEASQAMELDILKRCGRIDFHRQHPMPIMVNGKHICTLILDFWVFDHNTAKEYFVEVKGVETAVYRLKLKLLKACYPDVDLRIVRA